jgi:hypothetical protein
MIEVVIEDVSDDQCDTTAATRTSSNVPEPASISLHLRLMPLTALLEQKKPRRRYPSLRLPPG